jgi:hypothetical protein
LKPEEAFPLNTEIIAKITHVTKNKPIRIKLGTLDAYFKDNDDREAIKNQNSEED